MLRKNFQVLQSLLHEDITGRFAVKSGIQYVLHSKDENWISNFPRSYPIGTLRPPSQSFVNTRPSVALTAHIYYPEFADRLIAGWNSTTSYDALFVTVSDHEVARFMNRKLRKDHENVTIAVVENRGRNFGPMLATFASYLLEFDYFAHLHSKASKHTTSNRVSGWVESNWNALLQKPHLTEMIISFMKENQASLLHAENPKWLGPHNFYWLDNSKKAMNLLSRLGMPFVRVQFPFPAGGMFIASTESFRNLLEIRWHIKDFEIERGKLNGTLAHTVERLIGYLPFINNQRSLFLSRDESNIFAWCGWEKD